MEGGLARHRRRRPNVPPQSPPRHRSPAAHGVDQPLRQQPVGRGGGATTLAAAGRRAAGPDGRGGSHGPGHRARPHGRRRPSPHALPPRPQPLRRPAQRGLGCRLPAPRCRQAPQRRQAGGVARRRGQRRCRRRLRLRLSHPRPPPRVGCQPALPRRRLRLQWLSHRHLLHRRLPQPVHPRRHRRAAPPRWRRLGRPLPLRRGLPT